MMRVAICTPDLAPYDAVGTDVIGMYEALTAYGCRARIFARSAHADWPEVHSPKSIRAFLESPDDFIIYHHSVGWKEGLDVLMSLKCRRVVKYHNVTPAHFFEDIAANYSTACRDGRDELREIRRLNADLYLADSAYNRDELLIEGPCRGNYAVLPPFHNIDRLLAADIDQTIIDQFGNESMTNILMVGRVVPNKGYSYLIEAFHVYHRYYNSNSRLLIVGKEDPALGAYAKSLRQQVSDLSLDDSVFFLGVLADGALRACYQIASIFMITSLHEGFCVPLVEAMCMKVPIVAFGSTAVPSTVGKAGLVWSEYNPELMAASVDNIMSDKLLRLSMTEMGWNRYRSMFSNDRIKQQFMAILREFSLIS